MTTPCPHHWLLGDLIPGQPHDRATCKLCGVSRVFQEPFIDFGYSYRNNPSMPAEEREAIHYLMGRGKREV